jgi:phosphate:Na+ symporter
MISCSSMHTVKKHKDIGMAWPHSSQRIKCLIFCTKETEETVPEIKSVFLNTEKSDFEELKIQFDTIQKNYTTTLNTFYTEDATYLLKILTSYNWYQLQ